MRKIAIFLVAASLLLSTRAAAPLASKVAAHARNVILFVGDTVAMTGSTTRETSIGVDAGPPKRCYCNLAAKWQSQISAVYL